MNFDRLCLVVITCFATDDLGLRSPSDRVQMNVRVGVRFAISSIV